jgi:hypothetical protein
VVGIWLARNTNIFEDKGYPSIKVSQQTIALLNEYNNVPKVKDVQMAS